MNTVVSNKENFQTNSLYTILIQGMSSEHHFHRPNASLSCFPKSTFYYRINICNSFSCSWRVLKNEKAKFNVALRKYLKTHSFYSVDFKGDLLYKMFIAFYTIKIVYICVFKARFTMYCLCDTQMIHGICVCVYVCMCVYVGDPKVAGLYIWRVN